QHRRQGVAVGVGVVAQDARRAHGQRRVLGRRVAVVGGRRRVVHRGDGQGDGGRRGAVRVAVVGLVGEGVGAVVVGRRGVGEAAVGVERQRPVRRAADQHGRQCVPVHVRVVTKNPGGRQGEGRVLRGRVAVVGGDRRVVDRGDGQ